VFFSITYWPAMAVIGAALCFLLARKAQRFGLAAGAIALLALPLAGPQLEARLFEPIDAVLFKRDYHQIARQSPTYDSLAKHHPDRADAIRRSVLSEYETSGRYAAMRVHVRSVGESVGALLPSGLRHAPDQVVLSLGESYESMLDYLLEFEDDRCWGWVEKSHGRKPDASTDADFADLERSNEARIIDVLAYANPSVSSPPWTRAHLERFQRGLTVGGYAATTPDPSAQRFPERPRCRHLKGALGVGLGRDGAAADPDFIRWLMGA